MECEKCQKKIIKQNKENKTNINIPEFSICRKDKINIVGKSGKGKTTFLNILARYIVIPNSNYLIDGEKKKGNLDLAYILQKSFNSQRAFMFRERNFRRKIDEICRRSWFFRMDSCT